MASRVATSKANWSVWEKWFKQATKFVALEGDPLFNTREAWVFHACKLVIYFFIFTLLFRVLFGVLPGFNKLTFTRLILYELIGESCGFCCSSGPVGGQHPHKFPLLWHNLTVGTCKRPTYLSIGGVLRNPLDVALFVLFLVLLIFSFIFLDENTIHHSTALKLIFGLLIYFYIFDRTIFLACRAEYYGMYLICIYFKNGWLQACQILQIAVWFWAGVSKFGIWFDYVYPRMQAGAPTTAVACGFNMKQMKEYCKQFYKNYPNDLRPSGIYNTL